MTAAYQIRTYSRAGTIQHVVTDFRALAFVREVHAPGLLVLDLPPDHRAIDDFELDGRVEVWRRIEGYSWYLEATYLWRGEERSEDGDGNENYRAVCPGVVDLLGRAVVGYMAETTGRNAFSAVAAETVAKELVKYNATGSGTTADGRLRTVTIPGITIEATAGRGAALTISCAWRPLLNVLQDVAEAGGGAWDLAPVSSTGYEFRWYAARLGTDRSALVVFAPNFGNVANPLLVRDYQQESTVAIVGGQGSETSRDVVARTGANYVAGYSDGEAFVDARHLTTTTALQQYGDTYLAVNRARDRITFTVLQVPQTLYGQHYTLGDLVTAAYQGVVATKQVRRVSVSMADGVEQVAVELVDE